RPLPLSGEVRPRTLKSETKDPPARSEQRWLSTLLVLGCSPVEPRPCGSPSDRHPRRRPDVLCTLLKRERKRKVRYMWESGCSLICSDGLFEICMDCRHVEKGLGEAVVGFGKSGLCLQDITKQGLPLDVSIGGDPDELPCGRLHCARYFQFLARLPQLP